MNEEEYKRWQPYANALLLALTVLFAGTAIAFTKTTAEVSRASSIFGLLGIVLTVCWFTFESERKIRNRPAFLWLASWAFGCQVGALLVALLFAAQQPTLGTLS